MSSTRLLVIGGVVTLARICFAGDIDSETFHPTPAIGPTLFELEPADIARSGEWAATSNISYATNQLEVSTGGSTERPVSRRATLELGGAYAFFDRYEAGVRVPLLLQSGDSSEMSQFHVPAASGTAIGDVAVHARARLRHNERWSIAASLHVSLPTSSNHQFVGEDLPTARALALVTYRPPFERLELAVNAGAIVRAPATYRNDEVPQGAVEITQGSGAAWGIGAALRATRRLRVTLETFGEVVHAGGLMGEWIFPIDSLVGVRYHLPFATIGVAAGRGVTDSLGTPDLRAVLTITVMPQRAKRVARRVEPPVVVADADHDGVPDAKDQCPGQAEDVDSFQDEDGCPDPDDDDDLIPDDQDKCPDELEVINGVDDDDGCPDVADDSGVTATHKGSPLQAAEQTFRQGRLLMKRKQFAQACAAFEHSQRLDPQFGTQFNLAGCYVEIGKLATAWAMYRELARVDKNVERRSRATAAAAQLASRVPKLRLTITAPTSGLRIFMNGTDASALLGVDTPVDVGTYKIVAGAPGHKPWRQTIEVSTQADVVPVVINLVPIAPPQP